VKNNKVVGLLFVFFAANCSALCAHELYTSYTSVKIEGRTLDCTFSFDVTDLQQIFKLDANNDNRITVGELNQNLNLIQAYVQERIKIVASGEVVEFENAKSRVVDDSLGNVFVTISLKKDLNFEPWSLTIELDIFEDFNPRHKNLTKIVHGNELQQFIFTRYENSHTFSFTGADSAILNQIIQFTWLGIEHIFTGYDHILFLLGLIVIGGSFRNLGKMVTAFTVAHSITLILAALQIVMLPSRLVESVIALSIVYIAIENFLIKTGDERWMITFVFGLMHGFGFAGVLRELGLPTEGLVSSLLSFNVGVEIGQVAIIAFTFPVIRFITKTKWQKQFVYGLSSLILIFGIRAFGWDLPIV